ncbi:DUF6088 family protein [Acinetobacter soli]|uniref:AbiEi antitoxin C-terminal domain-containing protein n=1 Tax=Acinetobacter soli TaxID=487316 RepID=A0A1P8EN85_9GAMM|nr:DUF6088 family protein [Acinetobacter soli]APV37666.1 hypothetical protein BEN76_16595 [Acinetobacter soli]
MDDNIKRLLVEAELKNLVAGSVFSVQDFSAPLSKKQLLSFLSAYLEQGEVSLVVPNIYYKVKSSNLFNPPRALPPDLSKVLAAITRLTGETFQYDGGYCANRLGLSTQVPLSHVLHTSGRSRRFKLAGVDVVLNHMDDQRLLQYTGQKVGMAISALYYLGPNVVDDKIIKAIKSELSPEDCERLYLADLPKWAKRLMSDYENAEIVNK